MPSADYGTSLSSQRPRRSKIFWGIYLLVLVGLVVSWLDSKNKIARINDLAADRARTFSSKTGEYGRILEKARFLPVKQVGKECPTPSGVIMVNMGEGDDDYSINPWFAFLPAPIQPFSASDVGTIIGTRCSWRQVGTYSDGVVADRMQCAVIVVDVTTGSKIAEKTIDGPLPKAQKFGQEKAEEVREEASREVLDYVRSLPRFSCGSSSQSK